MTSAVVTDVYWLQSAVMTTHYMNTSSVDDMMHADLRAVMVSDIHSAIIVA